MANAEARTELTLGQRFAEYDISKELGRGGLSIVYEGCYDFGDGYTEKDYAAFKVFSPDRRFTDIPRLRLRFKFEQWITYRFLCRRLLTGGWGEADGIPYIKYWQIGASDLKKHIRGRTDCEPVDVLLHRMCDILLGVSFLHANGFIHRDLKPSNILLTGDGTVVADFGIARDIEKHYNEDTKTHDVMGSRDYIAPEQRNNPRDATFRSDIYSLGVVFYEMVTRKLPTYSYVPIGEIDQRFSFLDTPVRRMLAADPANRQPTVRQVYHDIARAWTRVRSFSDVRPMPLYPFVGLIFAKRLTETMQTEKKYVLSFNYELYHIEDLIAFAYYWLAKPYLRKAKVHIPTLEELKTSDPNVVMDCDISKEGLVGALMSEIENALSTNPIVYDLVGDPRTMNMIRDTKVF